jgi:ribosomal protein L40E
MKYRPNYKYKVFNAQICLLCSAIEVDKNTKVARNGIRGMICGKCNKKLYKRFQYWNESGIYLTKKTSNEPVI